MLVPSEPPGYAPATMSEFLRAYLTVAIFMAAAALLVYGLVGLGGLFRPSRPTPQKLLPYESGVDPVGTGWSQSQIRYYIFALLFVMFDVEAIFIFPWAIRLEEYGTYGLVVMLLFVVLTLDGLAYAWKKGLLRWA